MNRLEQLKNLTNSFYEELANGGVAQLKIACDAIQFAGVEANCHYQSPLFKSLPKDSYELKVITLEWYLGQLVDMYNNDSLFGVNTWLNMKEKFCDNL